MSAIRVMHTADLHLDWLFGTMPAVSKAHRRKELEAGFRRIIESAIENGVDALLVSGDLFHGPTVSPGTAALVKAGLAELAASGTETVLLPGNHDPSTLRPYALDLDMEGVHVFREPRWTCRHLECGLEVWGRPWCSGSEPGFTVPGLEETLAGYGGKSGPRVVMLHGQALTAPGMTSRYMPFMPSQLSALGADYIALGHVHKAGTMGVPGTDTVARYPGSPFRLSFAEASPRTVSLLGVTDGGRPSVDEITVEDRPYHTLTFNLDTRGFDDAVDAVRAVADPEACVQVTLTGLWEAGGAGPRELMLAALDGGFFHLEVVDRTGLLPPAGAEADGATIRGAFVERIREELAQPGLTEERVAVLNAALRLGLSALGGGAA